MAVVKEYMRLSSEYQLQYGQNTILLMQVGSFMEMYGPGTAICDVAKFCGLNVVTRAGDSETLMAGFKENVMDKYILKMQETGYTVVIYKQHPQDVTRRELDCIISPGTHFSTETMPDVITNNFCCIWVSVCSPRYSSKQKKMCYIGVANVDIYTGTTNVFQYETDYVPQCPSVFDQLERFVSIYHPLEAIVISSFREEELNTIIQYSGLNCKKIHKIVETGSDMVENSQLQVYQREIFSKFYGVENTDALLPTMYDNNMASQTLCYLLNFIYQHNASLLNKIKLPTFDNVCSNRLVLANHSLKQLNIIDADYRGKCSSVLKITNLCLTPMGKRLFEHNLLHPIIDCEELRHTYDLTEYFCNKYDSVKLSAIKTALSQITDVSKVIRQLHMFKISPSQIACLYHSIISTQQLLDIVKRNRRIVGEVSQVEEYNMAINTLKDFIVGAIHIETCNRIADYKDFDTNFIVSGYDADLDESVTRLESLYERITAIRVYFNDQISGNEKKSSSKKSKAKASASKADDTFTEYIKFDESDKTAPTLTCTQRRFELLRSALSKKIVSVELIPGFMFSSSKDLLSSSKNTASLVNIHSDELNALCNEYYRIKNTLKDNINRVYVEFVTQFETHCHHLELLESFITHIDLLYCKATIAQKFNYCKPVIDDTQDKSFVIAQGLRHPIIEQLQDLDDVYVDNDITLGTGEHDGMLLYGVNMAGKTSFIRSVGISIVMAQAGLFVPASSFVYKPYHSLFTRIIGNDNLFKGLSTFAVEMTELNIILNMADKNSMVIGDEVCAGTETISAASIFVSAVMQLAKRSSSYIFATHLHEITDFLEIRELQTLSLKHMDVVYNAITEKLVYNRKILEGSGSKTYGLEVCKSLRMPTEFLDTANELRLKYYSHIENDSILSLPKSAYNKNKLVGLCEKCKTKQGTETHHIIPQSQSDEHNFVVDESGKRYHKNSKRNLMTVCEKCHKKIHAS